MLEVLLFYPVLHFHEETTIYLTGKMPFLIISFKPNSTTKPLPCILHASKYIKIQVQS